MDRHGRHHSNQRTRPPLAILGHNIGNESRKTRHLG
jgi:hypothetical protein